MSVTAKSFGWGVLVVMVVGGASFAAFHYGHRFAAGLIAIGAASLVVNGFVAEYEDNAPGGFNDPRPKVEDKRIKDDRDA